MKWRRGQRASADALTAAYHSQASSGLNRRKDTLLENPQRLRELAEWYREFADKAASAAIWESRLLTADDFDREAVRMETVEAREKSARSFAQANSPPRQQAVMKRGFAA